MLRLKDSLTMGLLTVYLDKMTNLKNDDDGIGNKVNSIDAILTLKACAARAFLIPFAA